MTAPAACPWCKSSIALTTDRCPSCALCSCQTCRKTPRQYVADLEAQRVEAGRRAVG